MKKINEDLIWDEDIGIWDIHPYSDKDYIVDASGIHHHHTNIIDHGTTKIEDEEVERAIQLFENFKRRPTPPKKRHELEQLRFRAVQYSRYHYPKRQTHTVSCGAVITAMLGLGFDMWIDENMDVYFNFSLVEYNKIVKTIGNVSLLNRHPPPTPTT